MIEQINALRYKCTCDHQTCRYQWESDSIPDRCAKCKRPTWNRAPIRHGRNGHPVEAFGKSQTIAAWAREYKINKATIHARLRYGWTLEDAIGKPAHRKEGKAEDKQKPELGVLYWSKDAVERLKNGDFDMEIVMTMSPAEAMERYPDLEVDVDADGIITGIHRKVEV